MLENPVRKGFLFNLWLWSCELPEIDFLAPVNKHFVSELQNEDTWYSAEFVKLMKNRLFLGALRYGAFRQYTFFRKPQYDLLKTIRRKLKFYEETGNTELLVDIANYALIEFVESRHPNKHFRAADDQGHAVLKEF